MNTLPLVEPDALTCPISMTPGKRGPGSQPKPCGQPLADGAQFCAKHEDDRLRLGGQP